MLLLLTILLITLESPWYDLRDWLGVKSQLSIYLSIYLYIYISLSIYVYHWWWGAIFSHVFKVMDIFVPFIKYWESEQKSYFLFLFICFLIPSRSSFMSWNCMTGKILFLLCVTFTSSWKITWFQLITISQFRSMLFYLSEITYQTMRQWSVIGKQICTLQTHIVFFYTATKIITKFHHIHNYDLNKSRFVRLKVIVFPNRKWFWKLAN